MSESSAAGVGPGSRPCLPHVRGRRLPPTCSCQLTDATVTYGTSAFILASDDAATTERFATEVAPAVRREVHRARS